MKILLGTAALHPVNTAAPAAKSCNYWSLLLKFSLCMLSLWGLQSLKNIKFLSLIEHSTKPSCLSPSVLTSYLWPCTHIYKGYITTLF